MSKRICLERFTRFLRRECLLKETETGWHSEDCFPPDIYSWTEDSNWNYLSFQIQETEKYSAAKSKWELKWNAIIELLNQTPTSVKWFIFFIYSKVKRNTDEYRTLFSILYLFLYLVCCIQFFLFCIYVTENIAFNYTAKWIWITFDLRHL